MQIVFRLLLSINALSFMGAIFLIKTINTQGNDLSFGFFSFSNNIPIYNIVMLVLIFMITYFLTAGCLKLSNGLLDQEIKKEEITSIEPADDNFLSSYAGYFFVALSISDFYTFFSILAIMTIFIYNSRQSYFNPMFFIIKYHFFYLTLKNKQKVLIITKRKIKSPLNLELKQINDYTYIDLKGE